MNSNVVVLIPALNEREGLAATALEIMHFLDEPYILVIDGNSVDGTVNVAKRIGLDVIIQDGKGKGDALAKAVRHLRLTDPRYVVLIDADYTYPAEHIPCMIKVLEENADIGMVCGCRFNKPFNITNVGSAYLIGNRFLSFVHLLMNGVKMKDPLTGLRVVRWKIIKDWQPKSKGFDVEAELNYFVERKGYKILEIPISYRKRLGEKKLKIRDGFAILRRILTKALV